MAPVNRLDPPRASADSAVAESDSYDLLDLDDELKRLSAATQELLGDFRPPANTEPMSDLEVELDLYRQENDELRARIAELEAAASGKNETNWQERQKEYESLLEEKSEVIRSLHLKIQEMEESVNLGDSAPPPPGVSSSRLGQAEEILRLKRELEDQRNQIKQDEQDMIAQMREMELTMARERAEMARQRQELQRMKADLAREVEQTSRDPELRERLNTLSRRTSPNLTAPTEKKEEPKAEQPQKGSGFFKRIFGK